MLKVCVYHEEAILSAAAASVLAVVGARSGTIKRLGQRSTSGPSGTSCAENAVPSQCFWVRSCRDAEAVLSQCFDFEA